MSVLTLLSCASPGGPPHGPPPDRVGSVVQQREGGDGVHEAAAVLLDVGLADRQVLAAGAHPGGDVQPAGLSGAQVGDGELAGGGHVAVVGSERTAVPMAVSTSVARTPPCTVPPG